MADGLFGGGGAYFGNPNIARQGVRARELAQQRDVNTLPDPRTFGFVSGFLGTAPDQLDMSVLNPNAQAVKDAAYYGYQTGNALQIAPIVTGIGRGVARMVGQEITDVMSGLPARSVLGEITPSPMQLIGTRFKTGTPTEVPRFGTAKEIPDNYSTLSEEALKDLSKIFGGKNVTLQDILSHPSLYRDYPELAKYPVTGLGLFQNNLKGAYGDGKLYLRRMTSPTEQDIKAAHSTLLHEVQHAIQELDKMPMGGMTEDFLSAGYKKAAGKIGLMRDGAMKELKSLINDKGYESKIYYDILFNNKNAQEILAKDKDLAMAAELNTRLQKSQMKLEDKYNQAFQKYRSYAGEAQARAVQTRFENPEQYKNPVLQSYDVPVESLIYRDPFGNTAQ